MIQKVKKLNILKIKKKERERAFYSPIKVGAEGLKALVKLSHRISEKTFPLTK